MLTETAYAKINLALHVRERRDDGYHELETLFAFVDDGDKLTARSSERDTLRTVGEFASGIDDPFGNIVAKALGTLPHEGGLAVELDKRLPVAAGLGGGSADAGAVFRMIEQAQGQLPDDWQARAARLGADVPACVRSRACIGRGTGTELEPIENDLAGTRVLLVNPREPVPTGPVFKAWDGVDRGAMPPGSVRAVALNGRNDLEDAAISICPVIADVLTALRATAPFLARMSGSGATCFGLYDSSAHMAEAAAAIAARYPAWWQMSGKLR
ncbi:4-(cytidine 5'-diphospho)-2-C-methyl-D-erythritol kinase [Novosphingobium sp. M1R2S20]|uniref:4-diphosphocytidyl-2-C-methyl-D-erythritol kinase n=1 Tax=Novosphingobium rhizovicinum TaxID=3228928 RepID=A0ABV3R6Z0_9SPHN